MSNTKFNRARKASKWGVHRTTFERIWSLIPDFVIKKLSGRELGQMIDHYHQKIFNLGSRKSIHELLEHHGCSNNDLWAGQIIKKGAV